MAYHYRGFTIPDSYVVPTSGAPLTELCEEIDKELDLVGTRLGLEPDYTHNFNDR